MSQSYPYSQESFYKRFGKEIERVGKERPSEKTIRVGYHQIRGHGPGSEKGYYVAENPFYKSPESILEEATSAAERATVERFREFESSQTRLFESQRSEIAKQLQILQENKSAYEQMQKDYRRMMRKDTKAKEKAIEKRREALQIARANAARATAGGGLQIQYGGGVTPSGGGFMPRMGGTSQFKTRQSNMVNI